MSNRIAIRALPLFVVILLVLSSCGPAATPAATQVAAAPGATPTAVGGMPAATASVSSQSAASVSDAELNRLKTFYPLDKVRTLLADNFYLSGMMVGKGEEPQYGGVATFAHRLDIPSSDPMLSATISTQGLTGLLTGIGGLIRPKRNDTFTPEPFLAQSWEATDDFKVWTFKLRQDVKWHDGVQFTAEDIKFWIDLQRSPPKGRRVAATSDDWGPLKEVQILDPFTVRLVLTAPTPFLLESTTDPKGALAHPKHLALPQIEKGNVKVQMSDMGWVSLGPFKFDVYDAGSRMRVVRNPNYFEKDEQGRALPYLDAIDSPIIPDASVGVSAFRAGRIEGTARGSGYHLSPAHVVSINKDLKGKAWFLRTYYSGWGPGFNTSKPPFDDIKLRKAVQLFIDRQEWALYSYGGFGQIHGMLRPGTPWYNPAAQTFPGFNPLTKKQDQDEARRLLKESGYDGAKFFETCRDNYLFNCEAADAQFRSLGLNSAIAIVDTNRNTELVQSGNYQSIMASTGGTGTSLPTRVLAGFVSTNPLNGNKTNGDTKLDELDRLLNTTVDPGKRRDLMWEAEKYVLLEKAYIAPGPWEEAIVGYRRHIRGMWVPTDSPLTNNEMATVWIDPKLR